MQECIECQIFIGCVDPQANQEIVSETELREMVAAFFARRKIDFSMLNTSGGYIYSNGSFITESSICVNIIGDPDLDIIKLARSLSMYMNQEHVLVTRNVVQTSFC